MTGAARPAGTFRRAITVTMIASLLLLTLGVTPVAAATVVSYPSVSGGDLTNESNAYADDGVHAIAILSPSATATQYFGTWSFGSIPAGSTINSVTAEMEFLFGTGPGDATVSMQSILGGVPSGTAAVNSAQPITDTVLTNANLGTITRDDLVDPAHVQIQVTVSRGAAGPASLVFAIDYIRLRVDYTPPAVNQPPVLALIGPQTVAAATTRSVDISASDPEGGALTFDFDPTFMEPLPTWVTLADHGDGTATLSMTPGAAVTPGSYPVGVRVRDPGGLESIEAVAITVTTNQPPTISAIPNQTVVAGATGTYQVVASDAEGGPLTFGSTGFPAWASIDASTGLITMSPPADLPLPYSRGVGVWVADPLYPPDNLHTATTSFAIFVTANQPPVVTVPGDITVPATSPAGATVDFAVSATDDVDGTLTPYCLAGVNAATSGDTFPIGATTVVCSAIDAAGNVGSASFTITVENQSPVLDPIGTQTVAAGDAKVVAITATDPNGDALTFGSSGLPAWATLAPAGAGSATLTLSPGVGDSGSYSVVIAVRDPGNAIDSERITINVTAPVNQPPVLAPVPDQTVAEGATVDVQITATDPDGQPLTFVQSQGWPAWATLTDNGNGTATLHLAPDFTAAAGSPYAGLVVGVTDGTAIVTDTFDIIVTDVNQSPVLAPIGDQAIAEGAPSKAITISATDGDGDSLAFFAGPVLPPFATFTDNGDGTATLTLAPGFADAGSYPLTIGVTDLINSPVTEVITIVVTDTNRPPVLTPVPDQAVAEGATTTVTITATDPDGDPLTFVQSQGWPAWATLVDNGDGTATLTLAPDYAASASSPYILLVGVTDLTDTVTDTFGVVVTDVPDVTPPDVTVPATISVPATGPNGAVVTFVAGATDAVDGDVATTCTPASGSVFPVGTTTVTCTATDNAGNTGRATFEVVVTATPTAPPTSTSAVAPAGPTGLDGLAATLALGSGLLLAAFVLADRRRRAR